MQITRCDKCGKEITRINTYFIEFSRPFLTHTTRELCLTCAKKIIKEIDGGNKW